MRMSSARLSTVDVVNRVPLPRARVPADRAALCANPDVLQRTAWTMTFRPSWPSGHRGQPHQAGALWLSANDARSVAVAALRSAAGREVQADDHAAVLKVWSKRHRDLGRSRTQVACRLHAVLCELRATGERLCSQRGRLTPRAPALRPSHSRARNHPTTPARRTEREDLRRDTSTAPTRPGLMQGLDLNNQVPC
jgi:hypothetical protein